MSRNWYNKVILNIYNIGEYKYWILIYIYNIYIIYI